MRSTIFFVTAVALALFGLGPVTSQAAAVVSSGFDPAATLKGAVRYRAFGGGGTPGNNAVRIGTGSLAAAIDHDVTGGWLGMSAANNVTFNYNSVTGETSATVTNTSLRGPFNYAAGDLGSLNYVQIRVVTSGPVTRTITFSNVKINGENVGTFAAPVLQEWNVKGIDLTSTLTA